MAQTESESKKTVSPSQTVEKYFDMVYRLARKTAGADKADDAVQNVFLRYMRHYAEFEDEEHIKAWLIRVTYNCCRSELKNAWTNRTTGFPENEERVPELASEPEREYERALLRREVEDLPAKYGTVIHLYYYEDCSIREIAEITKQSETAVRSILHRGRQKLEKKLREGR